MKYIILAYTEATPLENTPSTAIASLAHGRLTSVPDISGFTECRDLAELDSMAFAIAERLEDGSDVYTYIRVTDAPITHADVSHRFIAPLTNASDAKKIPVAIVTLCLRQDDGVFEYRLFGSPDLPVAITVPDPDDGTDRDFDSLIDFLRSTTKADVPVTVEATSTVEAADAKATTDVKKVKGAKGENKLASSIFDWYELFAYAIAAVVVIMSFFVRHSPVEGSSMYPTLIGHSSSVSSSTTVTEGYDVLLLSGIYELSHGDIVIIQEPTQPTEPIVKRVIAMGGDEIKIDFTNGDVFLNGEKLDEDYVNETDVAISPEELIPDENGIWEGTVPQGKLFVLGDNRRVSKDSRYFGYIDERDVIGKAVLRILPLDRFGKID